MKLMWPCKIHQLILVEMLEFVGHLFLLLNFFKLKDQVFRLLFDDDGDATEDCVNFS